MEILSSYDEGWLIIVAIAFWVLAVINVLLAVWAIYSREGVLAGLGLIIFVIAAIYCGFVAYKDSGSTFHEVLIHDMSEFDSDRYEIIDQRGKIYTVREIK